MGLLTEATGAQRRAQTSFVLGPAMVGGAPLGACTSLPVVPYTACPGLSLLRPQASPWSLSTHTPGKSPRVWYAHKRAYGHPATVVLQLHSCHPTCPPLTPRQVARVVLQISRTKVNPMPLQ